MRQFRQLHTRHAFDRLFHQGIEIYTTYTWQKCMESYFSGKLLWLQQSCKFLACFMHLVLSWNWWRRQTGQQSWVVLGMSKGEPILCYHKGSATPFSVIIMGARSTICRTVGIAPPYLLKLTVISWREGCRSRLIVYNKANSLPMSFIYGNNIYRELCEPRHQSDKIFTL